MPFTPGFILSEAQTLLTMCEISADTMPHSPKPPAAPAGWNKVFTSGELGPLGNLYQLWQNQNVPNQYAIAIRATVAEIGSNLEDLAMLMIPACFTMEMTGISYSFQFAAEPQPNVKPAGIHMGLAIGALLLLLDPDHQGANGILAQLGKLPAGSEVFITGHSQGAALAPLVASYLYYPNYYTSGLPQLSYKIYAFAQPKFGNDHYAWDFQQAVTQNGYGIRITNPLDWVPQTPLTIESMQDLNQPNLISFLAQLGELAGKAVASAELSLKEPRALDWVVRRLAGLPALLAARSEHPSIPRRHTLPFSIMHSQYWVPAGSEITLKADTSYTHMDNPYCQHDLSTYQALLTETFG